MDEVKVSPDAPAQEDDLNFFQWFVRSGTQALLKPSQFFDDLSKSKFKFWRTYGFCAIMYLFSGVLSSVSGYFIFLSVSDNNMQGESLLFRLIGVVILAVVGVFIGTALSHIGVLMVRGTGGIKSTFQVIAFSSVVSIIGIIPIIGFIVGTIWNIVITIIGYKRLHNLKTSRAVMAFLWPLILTMVFFILLGIIFHGKPAESQNVAGGGSSEVVTDNFSENMAVMFCKLLNSACQNNYKDYKTYPSSLDELITNKSPYVNTKNMENTIKTSSAYDYKLEYKFADNKHYTLYLRPIKKTSNRTYYIDETGVLRLNGPQGEEVSKENGREVYE